MRLICTYRIICIFYFSSVAWARLCSVQPELIHHQTLQFFPPVPSFAPLLSVCSWTPPRPQSTRTKRVYSQCIKWQWRTKKVKNWSLSSPAVVNGSGWEQNLAALSSRSPRVWAAEQFSSHNTQQSPVIRLLRIMGKHFARTATLRVGDTRHQQSRWIAQNWAWEKLASRLVWTQLFSPDIITWEI